MAPDKQWMQLIHDRLDDAYKLGVEKFLDYAFTRLGETHTIRCPCIKCGNAYLGIGEVMLDFCITWFELVHVGEVMFDFCITWFELVHNFIK